jgi:hypothetical protein
VSSSQSSSVVYFELIALVARVSLGYEDVVVEAIT